MSTEQPARPLSLLQSLKRELAEVIVEQSNPNLFSLARATLDAKARRLRSEIEDLEHPSGSGGYAGEPTPRRGGGW